jgi:excisionase family DNA binding protein
MGVAEQTQPNLGADSGQLVSLAVARERLGGISRGSIYSLIQAGTLPTVRVGRRRMVDTRDLSAFIDAHRETVKSWTTSGPVRGRAAKESVAFFDDNTRPGRRFSPKGTASD